MSITNMGLSHKTAQEQPWPVDCIFLLVERKGNTVKHRKRMCHVTRHSELTVLKCVQAVSDKRCNFLKLIIWHKHVHRSAEQKWEIHTQSLHSPLGYMWQPWASVMGAQVTALQLRGALVATRHVMSIREHGMTREKGRLESRTETQL